MSVPPLVSVIIASHRPAYLGALLSALRKNTTPVFETIAVCDYDAGGMPIDFPEVIFQRVENRSISAKRNAGVKKASAPVVAFIDDDCIPSPEWVAKGHGYLSANPSAAAVEGLTTIENTRDAPSAPRDYKRLERPGFRTNNIFYRKAVFLDAGGFDERFTVQREDLDLAFSVLDKGYAILHDAGVLVVHRVRRHELWDLLKNCANRRFDPLLYKKHPSRYREQVGSPFPTTLLLLLLFHCVTGLTFFTGAPFFTASALVDAAAVTMVTLRRRGPGSGPLPEIFTEWLSCLCAPVVLLGALAYGSFRYGKLLLV
jgi:glycosyltransferase involved in cell wall biosynthesis